jgi:hypothetical protein
MIGFDCFWILCYLLKIVNIFSKHRLFWYPNFGTQSISHFELVISCAIWLANWLAVVIVYSMFGPIRISFCYYITELRIDMNSGCYTQPNRFGLFFYQIVTNISFEFDLRNGIDCIQSYDLCL